MMPSGRVIRGSVVGAVLLGLLVLAGSCTLLENVEQLSECSLGQKRCGDYCVAQRSPTYGCGAETCEPCPTGEHAIAVCTDTGWCTTACQDGWLRCEGEACTTERWTKDNCTDCGDTCGLDEVCIRDLGCRNIETWSP